MIYERNKPAPRKAWEGKREVKKGRRITMNKSIEERRKRNLRKADEGEREVRTAVYLSDKCYQTCIYLLFCGEHEARGRARRGEGLLP